MDVYRRLSQLQGLGAQGYAEAVREEVRALWRMEELRDLRNFSETVEFHKVNDHLEFMLGASYFVNSDEAEDLAQLVDGCKWMPGLRTFQRRALSAISNKLRETKM